MWKQYGPESCSLCKSIIYKTSHMPVFFHLIRLCIVCKCYTLNYFCTTYKCGRAYI
jgi:hypothetical protein